MITCWIRKNQFAFSSIKHQLTLIRNGETIWNKEKKWVGWADIPLSSFGIKQVKECAKLLKKQNTHYDVVYTSLLNRAIKSTNYILDELDILYVPVKKDWRLNEKHYGSLQGCSKVQMAEKHGQQLVTKWRTSLRDIRPPPLDKNDSNHPTKMPIYKQINQSLLPSSECLSDIVSRIKPLWQQQISKDIKSGKNVLIVAHGSSLRALLYQLMPNLSDEEIKTFNIPNAIPIILTLDQNLKVTNIDYQGDQSQISIKINKIKFETQKKQI